MEKITGCNFDGCITCPFAFTDESEEVQNYGCLPSAYDIIQMKKKSGHNWSCHGNESVMCGGFAQYVREYHPELDLSVGNLISYKTWYHEGEEAALIEASTKSN
jgi:hypothetical protein